MKILHVASSEGSGAGRAALRIHQGLLAEAVNSSAIVLYKKSDDLSVSSLNKTTSFYKQAQDKLSKRITKKFFNCDTIFSANYTPSLILKEIKERNADVVNLHWIGREFFKIEELTKVQTPLIWTLQDMWPFTGGCHYSEDCDRYTKSCGACPQLGGNKERDLSRWIWERKTKAWQDLDLTIVAPSNWIADCAKSSSLFRDRRVEVIPFCLDTDKYKPVDRKIARELLSLPQDKQLILFGAFSSTTDERKGFQLLVPALQSLNQDGWGESVELLVFGASQPKEPIELGFKANYLGRFDDDVSLSLLYSAADVMIVPSIQESFGQTASESLACGTPVVAFDATGLKDIVDHQQNGYLAKPYEVEDLAQGIAWVLEDRERHQKLRINAREKAIASFRLELQARRYSSLYEEILTTSKHQSIRQSVTAI
ncbi:glycosyltransferase family 4 protein [Pleurocapsa sp. PCC 7319]|uniref:glycosyltransferase family 4 protein n=1 Tax=Pleurocapsa sp. PCC 7319 TaxID=118161 RepID=UPI0003490084|nr:glycosyltransferase family 4 protein [Pleurocapsa sp. PCC 7319]